MSISELKEFGIEAMDDAEVRDFLDDQSLGVLGLPGDGEPYLIPLSFAFDGDSSLFFTYLLGSESRKERLTDRAETASFLVYHAETMFDWHSVLLTGRFEKVPPSDWGGMADLLGEAWRPEVFRTASTSRHIAIYEFEIVESSGIKHTGLASGVEE